MQNKSNKKSSYIRKKGKNVGSLSYFWKKEKKQVHVQGKGTVNKNIIIPFFCEMPIEPHIV